MNRLTNDEISELQAQVGTQELESVGLWCKVLKRLLYLEQKVELQADQMRTLAHGLIDVIELKDEGDRKNAVIESFFEATQGVN
jgi:hypothetical protein